MTRLKRAAKEVVLSIGQGVVLAAIAMAAGTIVGLLLNFAADVFPKDFFVGLLAWAAAMSIAGAILFGVCHYVGIFGVSDTEED